MLRIKIEQRRGKVEWLITIGLFIACACVIIAMLMTSGCRFYEAVGKDGEYFRAGAFMSDTEFDGLVAVSDPNSGLNIIVIDNFEADAETGEAGVFVGNILKSLIKP